MSEETDEQRARGGASWRSSAGTAASTDEDYDHMRKVVGYTKRHRAQGPSGDATGSRWRCSLLNRGHDPLE